MKFLCPVCGREEEIVGDPHPRCLVCQVEMIPPSDYSEVWMSPSFAIDRMRTISETYGIDRARKDGKLKREREAWTTAMLALALTKLTGQEWWIEIETVENTPDTKLRRVDQTANGNIIETYSVEIVDWEENVDDIMEVIRKKCARAYPSNYLLLVNARNTGKVLDFGQVVQEMKKVDSPFLEVWIVVFTGQGTKVVRVAPAMPAVELDRTDFAKASKQKTFLQRGTRSTKMSEFEDRGLVYVPIPRVD